jgi:hypothetical protein
LSSEGKRAGEEDEPRDSLGGERTRVSRCGAFSIAKAVNEVDSERNRHTHSGIGDEIRGLTVIHLVVIMSN